MAIGLTAGFAAISPIFEYLRPRRSPYLIPSLVGALLVYEFVSGHSELAFEFHAQLFLLPIFIAFALFGFLSLRYRDPTLDAADFESDEALNAEIDGQLKFARAMGIAVALWGTYYLAWYANWNGSMSMLAYAICILHLATFFTYMTLYNIRVEDPRAYSFFQIAAISSICVVVTLFSAVRVSTHDDNLLLHCLTEYEYTGIKTLDEAPPPDPYTYYYPSCDGAPLPPGAEQFEADPEVFDASKVVRGGQVETIDAALAAAAFFALLWLYLEWFWVRFFFKAVKISITVIDDANEKDRARTARQARAPKA